MRKSDLLVGTDYAIKYGRGIEKARLMRFERTHITHVQGAMMELRRRPSMNPVYWVGLNRIIEPWGERVARLRIEEDIRQKRFGLAVRQGARLNTLLGLHDAPAQVRASPKGNVFITLAAEDAQTLADVLDKARK